VHPKQNTESEPKWQTCFWHDANQIYVFVRERVKGIYGLAMKQLQFNGPDHKRWQIISLTAIVTSARKKH
jgi:hypothetical protein